MLLLYTGNGKGKTSACVGQAIRALGHGLPVAFAQFIKRPDTAGEQILLRQLLGRNFFPGGLGFYRRGAPEAQAHLDAAHAVAAWAQERIGEADVLILDECLYALHLNLLSSQKMMDILAGCRAHGTHLVLSGRHAPEWLVEKADTVTEMKAVRHAFTAGAAALKGIDR